MNSNLGVVETSLAANIDGDEDDLILAAGDDTGETENGSVPDLGVVGDVCDSTVLVLAITLSKLMCLTE